MNYEQMYKEALERARTIHDAGFSTYKATMEEVFPELAESEKPMSYGKEVEEKMMEACKRYLSGDVDAYSLADVFYAGVETGKELRNQKSVGWSEEYEEAIEMAIIALEDLYDEDEPLSTYGGHKLSFDTAADLLKNLLNCFKIQPKQEWSREDEQYLLVCKNALVKYQITDKWDASIISRWLEKRLKSPNSKPKQEWSEEDEMMLISTIQSLQLTNGAAQMKIDWLKSIKQRIGG